MYKNIAIIGVSGAIGGALLKLLSNSNSNIHAISRQKIKDNHNNVQYHQMDYNSEKSIELVSNIISKHGALDLVIVIYKEVLLY